MKTMVMGWFSYESHGATAGDLMACGVACEWLREAGHTVDVAFALPFIGGVNWRKVAPQDYSHLVFVCGPFGKNVVTRELLTRFAHCHKTGLNLSMLAPLGEWNPFDLLVDRDSNSGANPDITLLSEQKKVPVAGLL